MNQPQLSSYVNRFLEDCWEKLDAQGFLRTWTPYSFDFNGLSGIEMRFNNHWGDLVKAGNIEYTALVTDHEGYITHLNTYLLKDLESNTVRFDPGQNNPRLGAIYFGCSSPTVLEWSGNALESADYFYLAYDCQDSYSVVHAQPIDLISKVDSSSWPNCVQILAAEAPVVLIGNPSALSSIGDIQIRNLETGNKESIKIELNPFQITRVRLDDFPDGWYTLKCDVGRGYAHWIRTSDKKLSVRHM